MLQWISGVALTVVAILALAIWLESESEGEHERAGAMAQPRVPAASTTAPQTPPK